MSLVNGGTYCVTAAVRARRTRSLVLRAALGAALLAALARAGCRYWPTSRPDGVVAEVNGKPITSEELDQAFTAQTAGTPHRLGPEQALRLRLGLLSQLIDRRILLQFAAKLGVTAPAANVSREYDAAHAREPEVPAAELRQEITDNLVLDNLIEREVNAKVKISDAQIDAFYHQNQASFNVPEPQFHVLEIVVTPQAGPVSNLTGDKAQNAEQAVKKMTMITAKLAQGADFSQLAQQYSEDPNTAGSGGDLGLIPQSALLNQTPEPLRKAVLALQPGQVSPVLKTANALVLLKLASKEAAGVRDISNPEVRASIRELLTNARQDLLRTALLTSLRDRARVTNYLAEDILHSQQ